MNPEMFAREYGTTYRRFAETCKVLIHDGDLQYSQSNHTLLKSFWVTEPAHYDSNDDRLGQLPLERRWILDYSAYDPEESGVRELTVEEMSEAIDLYDCVTDELLEAFDELDLETSP